MPIVWHNHFTVDGGGIDEDHRRLMRLFNRIELEAAEGRRGAAGDIDAFRAACLRHFRRKERLQHLIRFPSAEDHRAHHANLLERLDDIMVGVSAADDGASLSAALGDLRGWLVDHIVKYDLALKPYAAALREHCDTD